MAVSSTRLDPFNRRDWRILGSCAVILVASLGFSLSFFDRAFPEASIDFRFDRRTSRLAAVEMLATIGLSPQERTHAARFDVDDAAKIYLERSLGLQTATTIMGDEVEVWFWTHRWFRPLETEELIVRISPRGEVVGFEHRVEETHPSDAVDSTTREEIASRFLGSIGVDSSSLDLVSISEKTLPARVDTTLVWEHRNVRPGGAPYRYEVTLHGGEIGGFRQWLEVPEEWRREYSSLRAKNETASDVAGVLLIVTTIAALFVWVIRIRRGDVQLRYSAWIGGTCALLLTLVSLNAFPSALAAYDTRTSFSSFLTQEIGFALLGGVSLGLFLMVMVGAGDCLFRERLPDKLAMPLLLSRRAFRSKRVFIGSIIGFTLVGGFLAYQVAFYLVAERLGAWAPAEIPYDETLNTLIPWVVVLFGGFFPAFSEEYISRAFSIPFIEKLLNSRFAAITISALIWGFAHSAYPNQPFFIRGIEVGIAGVILGYVVYRFGILPALVWHYTVDAIYTSLLLVQSGNVYYMVSSAVCAFIFAIPLIVSGLLYLRHGGFEADDDLDNRAIGTSQEQAEPKPEVPVPLPAPRGHLRPIIAAGAGASVIAAAALLLLPTKLTSLGDYPMRPDEAVRIAERHLQFEEGRTPEEVVVWPSAGFRSWSEGEDGGSPGTYDETAAAAIARRVREPYETLRAIMTRDVPAATWKVRFFTPGLTEEFEVEIDPRTGDVIGQTNTLEEGAPGATLEREPASEIATSVLRRFGHDPAAFELMDAVAVPMPDRRDWIFHFERRDPLADDAWMRVDVRLAGNRVSHVGRTVRIPETVRRAAGENRLLNTLLFFAQLGCAMFILVVVGSGTVIAVRDGGLRWRSPLRLTAMLVVPAVIAGLLPFQLVARNYPTSIGWDTFVGRQLLNTVQGVAFQLFVVFLSLVAIVACAPWATRLLSSAGRAVLGRDAIARALTAAAAFAAILLVGDGIELLSRVGLDVRSPVSDKGAFPLPFFAVAWRALWMGTWIAAFAVAARSFVSRLASMKQQRLTEFAIIIALALFLSDSSARYSELPIVFLDAVLSALVMWVIAKHLFAPNPLAVPLATLAYSSIDDIASWIRSGRGDLLANAVLLGLLVVTAFGWVGRRSVERRTESES